jgi:diguanylate cyclase (GGDEF)-like protein/PAS domain S-box-containing protein
MHNAWLYSDQSFFVFRNMIEQAADLVLVTDKNGFIEYVNPSFEKATGYSKEEVLGQNPRILQSGKQSLSHYQDLWSTILAGKVFHSRMVNRKKNGELYVADQTISPIFNISREITHFVCIGKDVTGSVYAEERLRSEKEKLEEIIGFDEKLTRIRRSDKLIDFVVAKIRRILKVEACSVMLVDRQTKQLYTKSMAGFDEDAPMKVDIPGSIAESVINDGQPLLVNDIGTDTRFKDLKQPSFLGPTFMIAPIKVDQNVIGVINVAARPGDLEGQAVFDVLDLKILYSIAIEMAVAIENVSYSKEVNYLTVIDPMTHTHNYRYFVNSLDYELKRLKRFQGDLSLIMADIDCFKSFNDDLGYVAGDELLKKVAQLMRSIFREVDVLCRYGDDEFVVILPGTDQSGAVAAAEKIRKNVESAKFPKNVTLSIGVADFKSNMTRQDLTFNADKALYKAKNMGKNRVCVI